MVTRAAARPASRTSKSPPRRPRVSLRADGDPGPFVEPLARALALLSVFTSHDVWLGNRDLAERTGLPAPTLSRLLRTLLALGYLHQSAERRQYRLAAGVMALGYAAIAHSDVQQLARPAMQLLADDSRTCVTLASRDRLEVVVIESCHGDAASLRLNLGTGTRLALANSPIGWALLAGLPDVERFYLLDHIERRFPREWSYLRRRFGEAFSQVQQRGFCMALGEPAPEFCILAAPLMLVGETPMVLACIGASAGISKARVERELGPRLVAAAQRLQDLGRDATELES